MKNSEFNKTITEPADKSGSMLRASAFDDCAKDSGSHCSHSQQTACSMPPRAWFLTFMSMNIPVIGWLYLLRLAFGKKENELRAFAKAYLLYKLIFFIAALFILGLILYIGMNIADKLLAYMEML